MPELQFVLTIVAAIAAAVVAALLLTRHRGSGWAGHVAVVLVLTAIGTVADGFRARSVSGELPWQAIALTVQVTLAAALVQALYKMKRLSGLYAQARRAPLVLAAWCAAPAVLITAWTTKATTGALGAPAWASGLPSLLTTYLGITLIVSLAQCERLLRKAQEATRYQLKFIVIGLGAIAGYQLYQASQGIPSLQEAFGASIVTACVTAVAAGLIWYGSMRATAVFPASTLYVPAGVLHRSITVLAIVSYLGLGMVLRSSVLSTGWGIAEALGVIALFLTGVSLIAFLASRTLQVRLQQWIARFVYHARYDYRAKWIEVTNTFQQASTVDGILDQLLKLLSSTFGAPRIAIWMHYEADDRFHRVRSVNTGNPPAPLSDTHPVVTCLRRTDEPMEVGEAEETKQTGDDPFLATSQGVLCVPLWCSGRLDGFVTLSREQPNLEYGQDDRHLLRAMAHHAGALLAQARLAEELRNAAEFEALHRVAAFCLHDLKNLTAQLSLVVQNAEAHGHDPRFQKSALRTVTGTVQKMMTLMAKLSLTTPRSSDAEDVNVHAAVAETLRSLAPTARARIKQLGESVPCVRIARDHLHQVLLNIILNAQQAAGDDGEIGIVTSRKDGAVSIQVRDNGPGMEEERLRTLFRPFRSTKPGGFGLGMYECKRIVAGYKGSIHVESEPGRGTVVTIILPTGSSVPTAHVRSVAKAV
jgi:hypothetical protein